jgi:hypothetical protein
MENANLTESKCDRCGERDHAGFVDYNISPVIMCTIMQQVDNVNYDPRCFEKPEKLREFVGLPQTPSDNYDMKEVIEKLNDVKNYNIGNVKMVTQPKAFTESICCYLVEERTGAENGYICFTKQAQEYAQLKGLLFLFHKIDDGDVEKICNILRQKFGDRFHWNGQNETIRIHLLEKPEKIS